MRKRSVKRKPAAERAYAFRDLWRDLWDFLGPYRSPLIFASVFATMSAIAQLWPWYAISHGVSDLAKWKTGMPMLPIFAWFLSWIAASAFRTSSMYVAKIRGFQAAEDAALGVRARGMEHLMDLGIDWHEKENAGNKLERINGAANGVTRYAKFMVVQAIDSAVAIIGTLIIICTVDPSITIATLLYLAVFIPVTFWLRRSGVSGAAKAVNKELEKASGATYESLNNVRTAKVLDMTRALTRIVRSHLDRTSGLIARRIHLFQTTNLVQGLLSLAFKGGALTYIIYGVMHGRYEIGFVLMFHGYYNRITDMAVEIADASQDLEIAKHSIGRMADILRVKPPVDGKGAYEPDWKVISLRNVSYSYAGRKVLRGVSFDIRRGERVGIVGLSGAGKSTLFKLLLKELEDYSGEILVDGRPLRDIARRDWYRHAAVVLQETEVFNFPLRQNITIAAQDGQRDEARLRRALDVAYVTDFLGKLPQGVETMIGEKGVKLSGGERQRVGIARAVFKRPDILFLDEATSHLDLESEERIRASLHEFFREVTAVVIAHRLTTIKEMDRVVVMEKGKLIEQGPFRELLRRRGRFHALWELQKLG
ncbi:MAG: hypothetical protein RLZZ324_874 [Candidatus Parcubacteria bacterium]|jgi:ABC-type multidrug transport system fused ATPase/permease subunit